MHKRKNKDDDDDDIPLGELTKRQKRTHSKAASIQSTTINPKAMERQKVDEDDTDDDSGSDDDQSLSSSSSSSSSSSFSSSSSSSSTETKIVISEEIKTVEKAWKWFLKVPRKPIVYRFSRHHKIGSSLFKKSVTKTTSRTVMMNHWKSIESECRKNEQAFITMVSEMHAMEEKHKEKKSTKKQGRKENTIRTKEYDRRRLDVMKRAWTIMLQWFTTHQITTLPMIVTPVQEHKQGWHQDYSGPGSPYVTEDMEKSAPHSFAIQVQIIPALSQYLGLDPAFGSHATMTHSVMWGNSNLSMPSSFEKVGFNRHELFPSNNCSFHIGYANPTFSIRFTTLNPTAIPWKMAILDTSHNAEGFIDTLEMTASIPRNAVCTLPIKYNGWHYPTQPLVWSGSMLAEKKHLNADAKQKINDRFGLMMGNGYNKTPTDTIAEFRLDVVSYYVEGSLKNTINKHFQLMDLSMLILQYISFGSLYGTYPPHIQKLSGVQRYDIPLWDVDSVVF